MLEHKFSILLNYTFIASFNDFVPTIGHLREYIFSQKFVVGFEKEFFRVVDVDLILLEKFLEKSCDYANIRITIEYFWPTLCRYVRSVAISSNKRNIVINKEIYVVLRKLHTIEDLFSTNSVF